MGWIKIGPNHNEKNHQNYWRETPIIILDQIWSTKFTLGFGFKCWSISVYMGWIRTIRPTPQQWCKMMLRTNICLN